MSRIWLTLSLLVLVSYVESLKWSQCGSKETIVMHDFDIAPNPVVTGKAITLTIRAETKKVLNGSDVKLDLSRSSLFGWVPLPCVFHFGSCTYHDSCTLFSRLKKENWGGKMADVIIQLESLLSQENINIQCPVPVQKMSIENVSLKLPTLSSTAALLVQGDYKMKLTAIDRHTKKVNLCMAWEMSIKA